MAEQAVHFSLPLSAASHTASSATTTTYMFTPAPEPGYEPKTYALLLPAREPAVAVWPTSDGAWLPLEAIGVLVAIGCIAAGARVRLLLRQPS